MSMEFTQNEKRGFYFLERGIKKIFPFIKSIEPIDNQFTSNFFVSLVIEVDFLKFLKFNNAEMSEYHQKYGLKNAKQYFKDYGTSLFLFPLVSEEYEENFGSNYNIKIENSLNNMYKTFPNNFIAKADNIYTGEQQPKELRIEEFKIYIDQKDIEKDEIKRSKKIEDELGL